MISCEMIYSDNLISQGVFHQEVIKVRNLIKIVWH